MNQTRFHDLPRRMRRLPLNERGYPVPWFVAWLDDQGKECARAVGRPDFRVIGSGRREIAVLRRLCWVCGERLGAYRAFVIGPMCALNRTTSEPPCHQDCAEFSARSCPFLSKPQMIRREEGLPAERDEAGGFSIDRNPGVACVWTTERFGTFRAHAGKPGWLIRIGDPTAVQWFAHGRVAARAEVEASVDSGYPILLKLAREQGDEAVTALERELAAARELYPAPEDAS